MSIKRKIQYTEYPTDITNIWCYFISNEDNPCNCGSNLVHFELENNNIYGVCNACKTDIYKINDENYKNELLNKGIWK